MSLKDFKAQKVTYKRKKPDYGAIIKSKIVPYQGKYVDEGDTIVLEAYNSSTSNAGMRLINRVQEGTGMQNRVGRHISLKSLTAKIRIQPTSTGTLQPLPDVIRVAIVYDRQPSGTGLGGGGATVIPNYNTIFQNRNANGTASSDVYSGPNMDNIDRYVIIKDAYWQVAPVTATAGNVYSVEGSFNMDGHGNLPSWYMDLTGLESHYNGTASPLTVDNIATGALYVSVCGLYTAATNAYDVVIITRLRFND